MSAQTTTLENFQVASYLPWRIINDGVMGGRSSSQMTILSTEQGLFTGKVSLANNGGFASTRAILPQSPVQNFDKIVLRVKGDGKKYSFRIRTNNNFDGVSYKMDFITEKDNWITIQLPLNKFIPTWRGRLLQNVPAIEATQIRQIGFLISDKQVGEFALLVDWIAMEQEE